MSLWDVSVTSGVLLKFCFDSDRVAASRSRWDRGQRGAGLWNCARCRLAASFIPSISVFPADLTLHNPPGRFYYYLFLYFFISQFVSRERSSDPRASCRPAPICGDTVWPAGRLCSGPIWIPGLRSKMGSCLRGCTHILNMQLELNSSLELLWIENMKNTSRH